MFELAVSDLYYHINGNHFGFSSLNKITRMTQMFFGYFAQQKASKWPPVEMQTFKLPKISILSFYWPKNMKAILFPFDFVF